MTTSLAAKERSPIQQHDYKSEVILKLQPTQVVELNAPYVHLARYLTTAPPDAGIAEDFPNGRPHIQL